MLPLSPAAVRRWAAGADPADLDDVEGARDPETPGRLPGRRRSSAWSTAARTRCRPSTSRTCAPGRR
ncbi:hypothetical protein ACFQXA_09310 [Nocardiopsis composta]